MAGFRPDIPPHVGEHVRHLPPDLKRTVKAAIRTLAANPHVGEPLMKELKGLWKYRVRRFRIVYGIDPRRRVIRIVAVAHRRRIYEEVTDLIRRRQG